MIAAHQANLVRLLDLREGERVNVTRIEATAGQWSLPGGRRSSRPARPDARQRFVGHAVRWLRFLDLLEEPHATQHAHAREVAVFAAQMRDERGWSEDTMRGCCHSVDRFFDWLGERGVVLASVRITDIDQAVARYHGASVIGPVVRCRPTCSSPVGGTGLTERRSTAPSTRCRARSACVASTTATDRVCMTSDTGSPPALW